MMGDDRTCRRWFNCQRTGWSFPSGQQLSPAIFFRALAAGFTRAFDGTWPCEPYDSELQDRVARTDRAIRPR